MKALSLVLVSLSLAATTPAIADCVPSHGFADTPPPPVTADLRFAAHTEEIVIDRPLAQVETVVQGMTLAKTIHRTGSLPGVSGTWLLTRNYKSFGAPGSRQFDCLSDGSTLEEQSLEREDTPSFFHFRYEVWNYTTAQARPIAFALGEFHFTAVDPHRTRIVWTYSFVLRPDRFPGYLGAFGRFIFHIGFLDTDYAALMKGVLDGYKRAAEEAS